MKQIGPTKKLLEAKTFLISVENPIIELSPIDVFPLTNTLLYIVEFLPIYIFPLNFEPDKTYVPSGRLQF